MKIFVTPPLNHLELSELGDNNFYVLAQLYKNNPKYREYVTQAKKQGRFLVCDNGAGDEGEVVGKEELFEIMTEIRPNEIIPTDVLFNHEETLENFNWFVEKMKRLKIKGTSIFACPQGNTIDNYQLCYKEMEKESLVSVIGWSKKTLPYVLYKDLKDRDQFIAEARNRFYLKVQNKIEKPVHCLGMGDPREFLLYKRNILMRSTDSCYAILSAINGIDLSKNEQFAKRIPTPVNYFDLEMSDEQILLAQKNIKFVKKCCEPIRLS